jgi:hypothetical protein
MKQGFSKAIFAAAGAGLVLGALGGCGGSSQPADSPAMAEPGQAAEGKACCKGMNECKGKGGCRAGQHSCAGQNECKGQGGCNGHCPK